MLKIKEIKTNKSNREQRTFDFKKKSTTSTQEINSTNYRELISMVFFLIFFLSMITLFISINDFGIMFFTSVFGIIAGLILLTRTA